MFEEEIIEAANEMLATSKFCSAEALFKIFLGKYEKKTIASVLAKAYNQKKLAANNYFVQTTIVYFYENS